MTWYLFVSNCMNLTMLTLSQATFVFMCLQYKSFENTEEKGKIAHNEG